MNTIYDCGIKFNPISVSEILKVVCELKKLGRRGIQITGVNLEQVAQLEKNEKFADYVNASDFVNIDGSIVYWYLKLKGYPIEGRALCADILYGLLDEAERKGETVFFLGATQDIIERLVTDIHQKYPHIIISGYHNGYFDDDAEIVEMIKSASPTYLFLGMPTPKKEFFISEYKSVLNASVCFGVGGMFDILAGEVNRAPAWIQKCHMEWLYRISQNPIGHTKRVWRALVPCVKVMWRYRKTPKNQVIE